MNTKLLTQKEQILLLRSKGFSIKEIAQILAYPVPEVQKFVGVKK